MDFTGEIARNGQLAFLHQGYFFNEAPKINPILKWKDKEPIRVGILGAHGVGKTTLANDLSQELGIRKIDEVTRTVHSLGNAINEEADIVTECMIWMGQLYEELELQEFIADRTLLDVLVYASWLKEKWDQRTHYLLNAIEACTYNLMRNYTALLYVPIEFELEADGVRGADTAWQQEIDHKFKEYLIAFGLDYFPIKGTRLERSQRACKYLAEQGLV